MKNFIDAFLEAGIYAYILIGVMVAGFLMAIVSFKFNKHAKNKWLANHQGAVKILLKTQNYLVVHKSISAKIISGDGAIFRETGGYAVYAMPGDIVLEVTYTYTRPGVLHRTVTTTWGPSRVEMHLETGKEYNLTFDKKEEQFHFNEM